MSGLSLALSALLQSATQKRRKNNARQSLPANKKSEKFGKWIDIPAQMWYSIMALKKAARRYVQFVPCRCGGIGRHKGLKIPR